MAQQGQLSEQQKARYRDLMAMKPSASHKPSTPRPGSPDPWGENVDIRDIPKTKNEQRRRGR